MLDPALGRGVKSSQRDSGELWRDSNRGNDFRGGRRMHRRCYPGNAGLKIQGRITRDLFTMAGVSGLVSDVGSALVVQIGGTSAANTANTKWIEVRETGKEAQTATEKDCEYSACSARPVDFKHVIRGANRTLGLQTYDIAESFKKTRPECRKLFQGVSPPRNS